jgi:hypothetical protein
MLDRRGLGFCGGRHVACSLRQALEASSMGQGFCVCFDEKGEFKITKGLNLMEFEEGPIGIKRVAYR